MGNLIWNLLEIYCSLQQWKNFANRSRIDKVIAIYRVTPFFFTHGVDRHTQVKTLPLPTRAGCNNITRQQAVSSTRPSGVSVGWHKETTRCSKVRHGFRHLRIVDMDVKPGNNAHHLHRVQRHALISLHNALHSVNFTSGLKITSESYWLNGHFQAKL